MMLWPTTSALSDGKGKVRLAEDLSKITHMLRAANVTGAAASLSLGGLTFAFPAPLIDEIETSRDPLIHSRAQMPKYFIN